jgi:protein-S-isoprenylcysteine O-methyltransferase Ste14
MHRDAQLYWHLIGLLWCAWGLYWIVSALSTKATQRREPFGSRLAHLVPLAIGGVLIGGRQIPVEWLAQRLWPRSLAACWLGVALVACGLAFSVWARVHLGRNWSGAVTVKQGHELVRSGPYAYARHPIYTGLLTALLGTVITSGTLRSVIGLAIITAALVRKLRTEERFMRETFPEEYARYSAAVPALIPLTRSPRSAPR